MPKTFTKQQIEQAIGEADTITHAACLRAADERYNHPEAVEKLAEANIRAMRIYQDTLKQLLRI